jgi:hypothetical protein
LFKYNPTHVIYVGHQPDQGYSGFYTVVDRLWTAGFTNTILGVLCGDSDIGMYDISDFRFIIPPLASVLSAAYAKMTRNDYLLTAAILCAAHHPVWQGQGWGAGEAHYIPYEKFEKYTFSNSASYEETINRSTYDQDIFLNGTEIATWCDKYHRYHQTRKVSLRPSSDAERLVFTALGLSESDYQEYIAAEEVRRSSLLINTEPPTPKIKTAFFDF